MGSKTMFIKNHVRRSAGYTLVETMVGVVLFSIAAMAFASLFLFSIKSFASLANYAILDVQNREAMDQLSREIRQAKAVKSYVSNSSLNSISILNGANQNVTFSFDANKKSLERTVGGVSQVLLTNCNLLNFSLFQRNPSNGNYGVFPAAAGNWTQEVKVVQLTWRTSRHVPAGPVNSENIQTARIVIRKQQND